MAAPLDGPSIPNEPHKPRVIVYAQTHHLPAGEPVSLLPLIAEETGVTHVIIAAIHINQGARLTLNDDEYTAPRFERLWEEVGVLQEAGIKVMGMLGGAAKGSYERLGGSDEEFETNYAPLHALIRRRALQGLDLDVEEPTPLPTILRLIDRLRSDFGPSFLITLAPVLPALIPGQRHLSGFDYFALERLRKHDIAWYNVQFYCGWGDAGSPMHYEMVLREGWDARRVVLGVVTCPDNGAGYVPVPRLGAVVAGLRGRCMVVEGGEMREGFGGVMGWEYFNGIGSSGERGRPWEWVSAVRAMMEGSVSVPGTGGFGFGGTQNLVGGGLGLTQTPFPEESVKSLRDLGFTHQQVVAALNMTGGNVEYAAGVLFDS